MKRFDFLGVMLAVLLLVLLGAAMPVAIGYVQDAFTQDKPEYAQIGEISLEIVEHSFPKKMEILNRADSISVIDDQGITAAEDVMSILERELEPYIQSGVIDRELDLENCTVTQELILMYVPGQSLLSNAFWKLDLTFASESWWDMNVLLDDQTGKLLHISFYADEYVGSYSTQIGYDLIAAFAEIYFENLGLWDAAKALEVKPMVMKDGSVAAFYQWTDEEGVTIQISFEVTSEGIFTYFP